jgi:AcrR family transcriptional regulator
MRTTIKPRAKDSQKAKSAGRLTSVQRRAAIVQAVRRVFAENGFHGTTTRELAQAADVSEALLFKHFPNKEALYAAIQVSCIQQLGAATVERLEALEPCAATLVILVHVLVSHILAPKRPGADDPAIQTRLMLQSLLDDGDFARLRMQQLGECWIPKIAECLQAAVAAGEAVEGPARAELRGWFVHHLSAAVRIHQLPSPPVVDYDLSREQLVGQVVWFAIRGMGLTDAAIQRHLSPAAMASFRG